MVTEVEIMQLYHESPSLQQPTNGLLGASPVSEKAARRDLPLLPVCILLETSAEAVAFGGFSKSILHANFKYNFQNGFEG